MKPPSSSIAGDANTQIIGDNNAVYQLGAAGTSVLTKSQIYNLLVRFMNGMQIVDKCGDAADPAPIAKKLVFNKAYKYAHIFREQVINYELLDEVIDSIPDSELIVDSLQRTYLDAAEFDPIGGQIVADCGDSRLDSVRDEITQRILEDRDRDVDAYTREQIEAFVLALMLYGVWKCKVLVNPNSLDSDAKADEVQR